MDYLVMLNAVGGLWGTILQWFQSWVGNFGLTIIVFTIALKLVLIPLDFWQRRTTRVNSQKQAVLQPEIEKLKKKYGNNEQMLNQKTMELYKANNYNVVGTCFGLLINMVVTLVIFFSLFSSLDTVSKYKIREEYSILETTYVTASANIDTSSEQYINLIADFETLTDEQKQNFENSNDYATKIIAGKEVSKKYGEIKEGFLWIKNIWQPDTSASIFPKTSNNFISVSGYSFNKQKITTTDVSTIPESVLADESLFSTKDIDDDNNAETPMVKQYTYYKYYTSKITGNTAYSLSLAKEMFASDYSVITNQLSKDFSGFNGYYILIILSGLITVASQLLMNIGVKAKNKKGEEVKVKNNTNIIMLILLPALMIYFTLRYTSAFSLYIIVNSVMSTLIGIALNLIMNKLEDSKDNKTKQAIVPEYSRKK